MNIVKGTTMRQISTRCDHAAVWTCDRESVMLGHQRRLDHGTSLTQDQGREVGWVSNAQK